MNSIWTKLLFSAATGAFADSFLFSVFTLFLPYSISKKIQSVNRSGSEEYNYRKKKNPSNRLAFCVYFFSVPLRHLS